MPTPVDNPTFIPTQKPTNDACDLNYDLDIALVVSNGCYLSDHDCSVLREFTADLIEKTCNPDHVTMTLVTHNIGGSIDTISGDRNTLLDAVGGLMCSNVGDATEYDGALAQAYTVLAGKSSDEQKIVMISFCDPDGGDDTCNVRASNDPERNIEITVVNVATTSGQFSCLVNGTESENLFEYPTIDEDTLTGDTDDIRDEICERPTESPTPVPTDSHTPSPTECNGIFIVIKTAVDESGADFALFSGFVGTYVVSSNLTSWVKLNMNGSIEVAGTVANSTFTYIEGLFTLFDAVYGNRIYYNVPFADWSYFGGSSRTPFNGLGRWNVYGDEMEVYLYIELLDCDGNVITYPTPIPTNSITDIDVNVTAMPTHRQIPSPTHIPTDDPTGDPTVCFSKSKHLVLNHRDCLFFHSCYFLSQQIIQPYYHLIIPLQSHQPRIQPHHHLIPHLRQVTQQTI